MPSTALEAAKGPSVLEAVVGLPWESRTGAACAGAACTTPSRAATRAVTSAKPSARHRWSAAIGGREGLTRATDMS